jgi:hypothetical protein
MNGPGLPPLSEWGNFHVIIVFIGIHNAWDAAVWIAARERQ